MTTEQENNNEPKEKPVSDFLDNNHHFWIPSYQRGYRWDSKQVEDLLEDLYQFAKDENPENKKYFLPTFSITPSFFCTANCIVCVFICLYPSLIRCFYSVAILCHL